MGEKQGAAAGRGTLTAAERRTLRMAGAPKKKRGRAPGASSSEHAELGAVDGLMPSDDPNRPDFGWVAIEHVRPWVQNPRKNARAVGKVADSIRAFGWGRPLVVNEWPGCEGELIVGHTAWLAAHELKLEMVPVRYRRMEPAAAHALAIADNKLGEISDWDPDELGRIVGGGEISASQLHIAGFSDAELEELRNPPAPGSTTIAATTECKCPKCGHTFTLARSSKKATPEAA